MKHFVALPLAGTLALGYVSSLAQQPLADEHKPRVYVADSDSWETQSSAGGNRSGWGASSSGGARPQTAEVIKTLGDRCPQVMVNARADASDYVIKLDHEGGKGYLRKDNKIVVFVRRTGDSIFSKSTLSVGGAVQDSCVALTAHWAAHSSEMAASPATVPIAPTEPTLPIVASPSVNLATLQIDASVPNADIEIDGAFAGNTPSTLNVPSGQHTIAVKKKGYADWARTMNVSGVAVHLNADLEKEQ